MTAKSIADLLAEYPDNVDGEITAAAGRDVINSNLNLVDGGTLQAPLNSNSNINTTADVNCSGYVNAGAISMTGAILMNGQQVMNASELICVDSITNSQAAIGITSGTLMSNVSLELPHSDGTLALTSDIPTVSGVYLPLAGGTMAGDINMGTHNVANASQFLCQTGGGLAVNNIQVVSDQQPAIADADANPTVIVLLDLVTAYDDLATKFNTLLAELRTHGLIDT